MSDYLDALSNLEPGETISAQGNPGGETTFTVNRNDDDDDDNQRRESSGRSTADATDAGLLPSDQRLLNEAERRDQEIIEEAVAERQESERADRDLREAADRRDREIRSGGFDNTLENEAERLNRESQELMERERETSDRDLFQAAREQGRREFIEQELDREDRVRAIQAEADAERARTQELREGTLTPTGLQRGSMRL